MKSKWTPFLICVCFLVASYTTKIAYQGKTSSLSLWTIYSSEGQLSWARVQLTGPDPEQEYKTTAESALKAYVDKQSTYWIGYHYHSKSQSQTPNAELNSISYYSVGFNWLFMTLMFAVSAIARSRKRKVDRAEHDSSAD